MSSRALDRIVGGFSFLVAAAVAAPSLEWPFGRDQGLYFYVGREWLHGALPYRDVFDQKTPAIYMLHALSIVLFGENMWGIRVLDAAATLATGICAAIVATPRGEGIRASTHGLGALAASLFYYSCLGFWDTAQCETWVSAFIVAGCAVAWRARSDRIAAIAAGALSGLALLAKPPAGALVIVCASVIYFRRRSLRDLLVFVVASALPWSLTVAYFVARGGGADLYDVVVRANGYYVAHERATDNTPEFLWRTLDFARVVDPLVVVVFYAAAAALAWSRDQAMRPAYRIALGLAVAAWIAVAAQQKFYFYHVGLVVAFGSIAVPALALTLRTKLRAWAPAFVLVNLIVITCTSFRTEYDWIASTKKIVLYHQHRVTEAEFEHAFRLDVLGYDYGDDAEVARFLRTQASPGDRLVVRGFETPIYALTGMSYGGRFFWTTFITIPTRAYRRAEWVAQDRADLERITPRWLVALRDARFEIDSVAYAQSLGYVVRKEFATLIVMERH